MALKPLSDTARLLIVVGVAFFAIGMANASFGPSLQGLADQTGAGAVAVGGMFTAIFAAALASQLVTSLVVKRAGERRVMLVGMIVAGIGLGGIAASPSLAFLLAAAATMGLGVGALILVGNVLAAEASDGAGPLNLVNAMYGVGAIVSPALVGAFLVLSGTGIPALWGAPAAIGVAILLLLVWRPREMAHHDTTAAPAAAGTRSIRSVVVSAMVWVIAAFVVVEVTIEVGLAAWLPTILERATALPLAVGATVMSLFWFLLTASRFVAAWASRFASPIVILRVAVLLCVAGTGLLLIGTMTENRILAIAAVALIAPGVGPILPSALAIIRASYPRNASVATGIVFGITNIGGAGTPLALGALIVNVGPNAGTGAMLGSAVAMTLLVAVIGHLVRKTPFGLHPPLRPGTAGQSDGATDGTGTETPWTAPADGLLPYDAPHDAPQTGDCLSDRDGAPRDNQS